MEAKGLSRVEVKDADKGQVEAVFATYGVIDLHHDVTVAGAFEDGAPVVISSYNHGSSYGQALPVGKGTIRATSATEAIMAGQFLMDTAAGRDTFVVVKAMEEQQEWSYYYDAVKFSFGEHDGQRVRFLEKQKVHEVSPVLVGAGINTRTLTAKGGGQAMTFADEAAAVLAAVASLSERAAEVVAKRLEKGKALGADSSALLTRVKSELGKLAEVLARPDQEAEIRAAAQREFLRAVARRQR